MGRTELLTWKTDYERALVAMALISMRAKWRSSSSAYLSLLEKYLTPPALLETRFFTNYGNLVTAVLSFSRPMKRPDLSM